MSDIQGKGWGFDHDWENHGTGASRTTLYKCRLCKAVFAHHYPSTPSIGKAMFQDGVAEHCPALALQTAV